jgi:hypothetical protein
MQSIRAEVSTGDSVVVEVAAEVQTSALLLQQAH